VRVEFALPSERHARVDVIDLQGRQVAVLADATFPAGRHQASWNTRGRQPASAGVYFVRLVTQERTWVRRFVLAH
jgi:hypothetical protein